MIASARRRGHTISMSALPPKAEVARRRWHFRYVPIPEVAMPTEEPSTASTTDVDFAAPLIDAYVGGLIRVEHGRILPCSKKMAVAKH